MLHQGRTVPGRTCRVTGRCMAVLLMLLTALVCVCGFCAIQPDSNGHVTIPDTVSSIATTAFASCSTLQSVTIADSVTSIGEFSFYSCTSLSWVAMGNAVVSIGGSAFKACLGLPSLTIGNSVTSVGDSAFEMCNNLSTVFVPESVTMVGDGAFPTCLGLGLTLASASANNPRGTISCLPCSSRSFVAIPDTVISIGNMSFVYCDSITSVFIPDSVTFIGRSAFSSCGNITSVVVGNSVTYMSGNVFSDCGKLTTAEIPASVTFINSSAFVCAGCPRAMYTSGANFSGCISCDDTEDLVVCQEHESDELPSETMCYPNWEKLAAIDASQSNAAFWKAGVPAWIATVALFCATRRLYFGVPLWEARWLIYQVAAHSLDFITDVLWYEYRLTGAGFQAFIQSERDNNYSAEVLSDAEREIMIVVCIICLVLAGCCMSWRLAGLIFGLGIAEGDALWLMAFTNGFVDLPMMILQIIYYSSVGFDPGVFSIVNFALSASGVVGISLFLIFLSVVSEDYRDSDGRVQCRWSSETEPPFYRWFVVVVEPCSRSARIGIRG